MREQNEMCDEAKKAEHDAVDWGTLVETDLDLPLFPATLEHGVMDRETFVFPKVKENDHVLWNVAATEAETLTNEPFALASEIHVVYDPLSVVLKER